MIPRHRSVLPRLRAALAAALAAVVAAALFALAAPGAASAATPDQATPRPLYDGMLMTSGSYSTCFTGFNVRSGSDYYIVVSGACTQSPADWYIDGVYVGSSAASSSPAYGLVGVDTAAWAPQSAIMFGDGTIGELDRAATPAVGSQVCTGNDQTPVVHCGTVTALNATINYGGHVLYGLVRSTLCPQSGPPGTPVYSGDTAVGLILGGSGDCTSGGTTYIQPLAPILSSYGLTLA